MTKNPYEQSSRRLPASVREALFLMAGSAAVTMIALSVLKAMAFHPETPAAAKPENGRFVGIRHEATSGQPGDVSPAESSTPVSNQDLGEDHATIVRNGVTIVSPKLLVPVIDEAAVQTATQADAVAVRKISSTSKRSHRVVRARSQSRKTSVGARRWRAYQFVTR